MWPADEPAPVWGRSEWNEVGRKPSHLHEDCAQLIYAERGLMSIVTPGERWLLPPGRALWIPRGMEHGLEVRRPASLKLLNFRATLEGLPDWCGCAVVNVSPLLRALIWRCVDLPRAFAPGSPEERLARVLVDEIAASPHAPVNMAEPRDPRAARLARMLRDDPADRRGLEALAPLVGASPRTVQRLFVREAGTSFGAWRNRLRLLSAIERMAEGAGVASAAYAVGYDNPSSFIASFRAMFGVTPRHYFNAEERAGLPDAGGGG
jgi:AraC-like DNA-binding protein